MVELGVMCSGCVLLARAWGLSSRLYSCCTFPGLSSSNVQFLITPPLIEGSETMKMVIHTFFSTLEGKVGGLGLKGFAGFM